MLSVVGSVMKVEERWLNIINADIGQIAQLFYQQIAHVICFIDFLFFNANGRPPVFGEIFSLSFIALFILMPICAICFKGDLADGDEKINTITAHLSFLNKLDAKNSQSTTNAGFKKCFALKLTIASKRTELSIRVAWAGLKFFIAIAAFYIMSGMATFCRTVFPPSISCWQKGNTASFAFEMPSFGNSTFVTTNSVPVFNRCGNLKGLATDRTNLGGHLWGVGFNAAFFTTEFFAAIDACARTVYRLATEFTDNIITSFCAVMIALRRTIGMFSLYSADPCKLFAAAFTGIFKRHDSPPLIRLSNYITDGVVCQVT